MIEIDGSEGEGGGQVLRTSLGLSALTGQPFRITKIRAKRARGGLLRQHLTGVRAVAEVCGATVDGDTLGSTALTFVPGPVKAGSYTFNVGTAGSAGLVLQAVLTPLLVADGPSTLVVTGGTHNPTSPPAPFLEHVLFPLIERMGPQVRIRLDRYGFYPAGGGQYTVEITPAPLRPLILEERGPIRRVEPVAVVANLPRRIAHRELETLREMLGLETRAGRTDEVPSAGPGNVVWIEAEAEHVTEVFTAFGRKGTTAELVAREAGEECARWLASGAPVGAHLADQLLVPMALAAGGSYLTHELTEHTRTNAGIIGRFLDRTFSFVETVGGTRVSVR